MKPMLVSSLLVLSTSLLNGCSTTSEVRPYVDKNSLSETMQRGLVFSLPKTIFEVKITYSLYDKSVWSSDVHGKPIKTDKDGKLLSPKSKAKIIVVEKPIEVSTKTIADPSVRFVFDPESLNGFSKDTDMTIDLTANGMLKSTNLDIKDKTKDIVSNVTGTVFNLAKIAAVAGEDIVELTLVKDVKVSRIIDPSDMDFKSNNSMFEAKYSDMNKSEGLFGDISIPEVVVSLLSPTDIKGLSTTDLTRLKDGKGSFKPLSGFPYRAGSSVRVVITVDDLELYDFYHMVAQSGGLALIPINAKSFTNVTQGLSFGDDGASLIKFTSKGTSRGEALSLTTKETTNAILSGVKDIDQTKLDKLKKDKELLDAEAALETAEKATNIQAKIDLLKKEKELIDAELALIEAKKKQEAPK